MSLQTLKKKGVIEYGSRRSAKGPGGVWLSQGPFGLPGDNTSAKSLRFTNSMSAPGPQGFSINGGMRNVGGIGKSSAMSKMGTPFRGQFARGFGGSGGRYSRPQPLLMSPLVRGVTQGQQAGYIKPSVLSTKGMLEKKYMWINNGQYPNVWVQPNTGNTNLANNSSQWLYIQNKAAANVCVNDTNKPQVYEGYRVRCSATGCNTTTARYKAYKIMESAVGYTKTLGIPQTSSQYTLQVQRRCQNPIGPQKPFPFASNGGSGNASGSYAPPAVPIVVYDTPPAWYWDSGSSSS